MSADPCLFLRSLLLAAAAPTVLMACGDNSSNTVETASIGAGGANAGASGGTGGEGEMGGSTIAGAGGAGMGGASTSKFFCKDPVPVLVEGKETGVETCADGSVHKKVSIECPVGTPSKQPACKASTEGSCSLPSDCTEKPNGYCLEFPGWATNTSCGCFYGCTKDSDCGPDQVCLCGDPIGKCVTSTCTGDSDCSPGNICSSYDASKGCGGISFACHTDDDACGNDADCGPVSPMTITSSYCVPEKGTGVRHCENPACMIGRPLFVEDQIIVAKTIASNIWA